MTSGHRVALGGLQPRFQILLWVELVEEVYASIDN